LSPWEALGVAAAAAPLGLAGLLSRAGTAFGCLSADRDALAAFHLLARTEGILPALESSHAVAKAMETARGLPRDAAVVVCLSGRGDKDAAEIARLRGVTMG